MKKGVEQKKKEPKPKKGGLFQSLRLSSKMSILIGLCSAIALIGTGSILICNDLLSSVNHRKSPQTFI